MTHHRNRPDRSRTGRRDSDGSPDDPWQVHSRSWRDPASVIGFVGSAPPITPGLLRSGSTGDFWGVVDDLGITLLVSREYEHLLVALSIDEGRPHVTFLQVPHPSGIAADPATGTVHVACTRNPNQILDLAPTTGHLERSDAAPPHQPPGTLAPVRSQYYPGSLYLHDLAMIGGQLHGNAVGCNSIVRLPSGGGIEHVWWPRCIEGPDGPYLSRNHLQLNSIAAGGSPAGSFFSASTDRVSHRRPGHLNFPVDGRGVIFAGDTGEPVVRGLTRPHSARLHEGALWADNSGYGQLVRSGLDAGEQADVVAQLPGWTRGLCLLGRVAFVGTSRVIARYSRYAPGLDVAASVCGVHAVDTRNGSVLGSLTWPAGNQIFAIEALPRVWATGLPGRVIRSRARPPGSDFYYSSISGG